MSAVAIPIDKLVSVYLKIRNTKRAESAAAKKRAADLEAQMLQIEAELLRRQREAGTTGFTIKGIGTTYTDEDMKVSIGDAVAFLDFCRTEDDGLEFLQHRVATTHLQKWMKANPERAVPGLQIHRELRVRVRTANNKPNQEEAEDE
jgi:hypothetical protein